MKEITLPEFCGVDDNGKEFGLAEFLTDLLFTRPDLLKDTGDNGFCEMVSDLMLPLKRLHGREHVGKVFRISDEYQRLLLNLDWSNPRIAQHSPESALTIAQLRLAVKRAVSVKEEPKQPEPEKKSNGAKKQAATA